MRAPEIVVALVLASACGSSHAPSGDAGGRRDAGDRLEDGGGAPDAGFTVPAGQSFSQVRCDERGTTFYAEIWPTVDGAECAPPPDISEELLILGIDGWDGSAGTFIMGESSPRGTARGGTGASAEPVTGTITIEPFPATPEVLSWDLSVGSGRVDLRTCGRFEMFPCEPPPACEPPSTPPFEDAGVAARLARWLWGEVPDDTLRAAAEAGELSEGVSIEAHAARMLEDPRLASGLGAQLVRDWLRVTGPIETSVDIEVLRDLPTETSRFLAEAVRSGGDRGELLAAAWSIRNGNLSRWYGATSASEDWALVDISGEARRGALTHGSVMVWHDNPSERGALIRSQLLCQELPPHPPGVGSEPELDPTRTRREQWEANSAEPSCAACHRLIDPIGFAFEHFDENGAYRTTDSGFPVDASGELVETDVDGAFADLRELLDRLSTSDDVRRCIVTKWFEDALGHAPDECSFSHAYHRFRASGDDLRELILGIAASPAFRAP